MNELIKKYKLDKSTWTHKGFHGVLHTFFAVGHSVFLTKDFFGDSVSIVLYFIKDNYVNWYWNDDDLIRIRELFFKRLKQDPNYLDSLQQKWEENIKIFDSVIAKVHSINLSKLSDKDLSKLYMEFYDAYTREFAYFMALGDAISMHADRYLVPEFEKILGKQFASVFPKLITTKHKSFVEQEQHSREKLINTYLKQGSVPDDLLKKHSAKFFYILNSYARGDYLSADDFRKMVVEEAKKYKPNSLPQAETNSENENKKKLIKKYNLSPWQSTLLDVFDEFFGIQDTRKKYVLIANHYQYRFLREVERRMGISFKLLQYSIYPEYKDILDKKIDKDLFAKRKQSCLCINTPGNYEIFTGKIVEATMSFFTKKESGSQELKGMVASKGKAEGKKVSQIVSELLP